MNAIGRSFIALHVWLFRATNGAVGGSFGKAGKTLLLTTTGKKTGLERTVPVMYFTDGDDRIIVASNNGAPSHPAWYFNLKGQRRVKVEVPGSTYSADAIDLTGEDREQVFGRLKAAMPQFAGYEGKVAGAREIPVVRLKEVRPG